MDFQLTADLLDSLGIALCIFDAQECTVLWNASFLRLFPEHDGHVYAGEPYVENLRRFYTGRLAPEDLPYIDRFIADGLQRFRSHTQPFVFLHQGRWLRVAAAPRQGGGQVRIWLQVAAADANGQPGQDAPATASTCDPNVLPPSDTQQMLEDMGEAATVMDGEGHVLFANDRFLALYGLSSKAALRGCTYAQIVQRLWDAATDPQERARHHEDLAAALRDAALFAGAPFELPLPGARWLRVAMNRSAGGQSYALHTDITGIKRNESELRASEQQLRVLAEQLRSETQRDMLTGLLNRRSLQALLHELCHQAGPHALLFIDLDGFKAVNDQAGHAAGDQVLRRVATRLTQCVRQGDTLVRLGGDEFVLVLPHCGETPAQQVGRHIIGTLSDRDFVLESGQRFRVGASIGVRLFGGMAEAADTLLADADAASYAAKRAGRGRVEMAGAPGAGFSPCASRTSP